MCVCHTLSLCLCVRVVGWVQISFEPEEQGYVCNECVELGSHGGWVRTATALSDVLAVTGSSDHTLRIWKYGEWGGPSRPLKCSRVSCLSCAMSCAMSVLYRV